MDTPLLTSAPIPTGMQEGFATEAEAVEMWRTLEDKFEYGIKHIVSHVTGETIAVVFVKCDPAMYETYFQFGEVL